MSHHHTRGTEIFPSEAEIVYLVGSLSVERNEQWQLEHQHM